MLAVVVQHVSFEGPGLIAPALPAADIDVEVRVVRADRVESSTEAEQSDILIILGGPMSALADREHPHLQGERELAVYFVDRGKPVLGGLSRRTATRCLARSARMARMCDRGRGRNRFSHFGGAG